jgi:RNA polymerase sigma factor (sigma-70 family)
MDDNGLLRRYVEAKDAQAFATLVERHVNLVYFAALRQTHGNRAMAEDVAQEVFSDLARKAPGLRDRAVLAGWLYTSTRYAAAHARRAEGRRRTRENQAFAMQELTREDEPHADWGRLRPVIDDALQTLPETDREAVLLRFFEGRAFAEVGAALRLTEDAARKRVERALERLAGVLSNRGVTSTSAALGIVLAQQAAASAPVGLAQALTASAISGSALTTSAAVGVLGGWATAAVVATVVAAGGVGATWWQTRALQERDAVVVSLTHARDAAHGKVTELERRVVAAEARAKAAEDDNAKLIAAIQKQSAARTATLEELRKESGELPTRDQVDARWRRAQELARSGDPKEALMELLWCYDRGMRSVGSYSGVRSSFLLSTIAKLGEKYPPALDALRERAATAKRRLLISENDYDAVSDFASLHRTLKQPQEILAVFDELPEGDRRRRRLASGALDELVEQRRYAHALEARNFEEMMQFFMSLSRGNPEPARRKSSVGYVANYVQILAGVGQTDNARAFAKQLLAFAPTEDTWLAVQQQVARAGHPHLLEGLEPK